MRLIAAITDPNVARGILDCLALSSRAPPLAPGDACEPTLMEADGDRDFDFDQSPFEDKIPDDAS
jgi:hypothetical protein